MCGIFDVYQNGKAQKINITQLEQATNTLRQRGPDMELVKKEWVDILRGDKEYYSGIWRWLNIIMWAERYRVQY